jgi:FkbM family methyltransferase
MIAKNAPPLSLDHPALRWALWPALALRRQWLRRREQRMAPVFERIGSLFAEDPVLRVQEFEGVFALSARSALFRRLLEQGEYEPALTRECLQRLDPTRDAIDVGANIGFHSVLFAQQLPQRRVLAVEPTENARRRLLRNVAMNGVEKRVLVFAGAASDRSGSIEIHSVDGLEEFSSIGAMAHPAIQGRPVATEQVATRTLDELVAEHDLEPGLLKVDVEGFEHHVFAGAQQTLARHRPVVVSELSDYLLRRNGASAREVVQGFEALGYRVFDPLHPNETPGNREFADMVCVPR